MWDLILAPFASDIAIDLGTATTRVWVRGRGVVVHEPSMVAVARSPEGGKRVVAVGTAAREMVGRTPGTAAVIRPMKDGVIAEFAVAEALLRAVVRTVHDGHSLLRPRIVLCVPSGVTPVERRAVREVALAAGAREALLIEAPMAAALGAGLPVAEPFGSMVVDIGGGTTEVAVLALQGIVVRTGARLGGDRLDEAIRHWLADAHGLQVGIQTAERVKLELGSAGEGPDERRMTVLGIDREAGVPREAEIGADGVARAIAGPLHEIARVVRGVVERTPPELAADLIRQGMTLTGGGALLPGLDRFLHRATGLPVALDPDPLRSVVLGIGRALDDPKLLRRVATG